MRVFSVPVSAPFLRTVISALVDGRLVAGFEAQSDPARLANATLYLPTRRAGRLAREIFLDVLESTIAVVPRIIVTLLFYPALLLVVSSGSPIVYVVTAAVLMAFHAMSGGAGIILIPLIFPAIVRTSGLSIAYALGVTIFGGTAQLMFTWIIGATGDKLSWVWYVVAMGAISILATIAIRVPDGDERRRDAVAGAAVASSSS